MDYQNGYADLIMVKNNGNNYDRNNYEINTNKRNYKLNSKIKMSNQSNIYFRIKDTDHLLNKDQTPVRVI